MARPIGIDLFAGAGGLSLAFEQAGFDVAAAVEIDPVHAAAHKFNFPECAVLARSVEGLSGAEIRKSAAIGRRKVSVVFGGAPCQGFSMIGARVLDDPRNSLVREFVRIVHELDADFFVFENVKGITVGQHIQFLHELIGAFHCIGYEVQLPWRVLNAADYGVPQDRERLFLMGCKKGLTMPSYPAAKFRRPGARRDILSDLPLGPTCQDALGDLPDAETFDQLLTADSVTAAFGPPSAYASRLRRLANDADDFGHPRVWIPGTLTSSARTDHSTISRRRFLSTSPGTVEPISRFFKLASDGISNTLRAGTDGTRGAFTSPRPIHYEYSRCITVREMARLHGFPDWFRFQVTKWHGARQIGNAVPPPLGQAVAAQVMKATGMKPTAPTEAMPLGDVKLLSMDLGQAAAHFGVQAASGKRTTKGVPRRRQWDDALQMPLVAE